MSTARAESIRFVPTEALGFNLAQRIEQIFNNPITLLCCKVVIGITSAYDIHQTIKYVEFLPQMELNPIGRWLMDLDRGPACDLQQAACFITLKFVGNFACLAILELLGTWRPRVATIAAVIVAGLQLVLLYFLVYGDR